jgi:hypothetical protein
MLSEPLNAESHTHYEKRKQLEYKLQQDQEELEILQSSLTLMNDFSDKVARHLFF